MISQIVPLAVGNALQVFLAPPADALSWRLLRNQSGTFVSQTDPAAVCLYSGNDLTEVMDSDSLVNGTPYCYCVFYCDGTQWVPSAVAWSTPSSTYEDQSVDVLSIVRDRFDCGLQNEIVLGTLSPSSGAIAVLNAPPVFEETSWPVVTVHVTSDGSGERGLGELLFPDEFDPVSTRWTEAQGWLARVQLTIVGWSKNPDERIALRKALRKIVLGNLEVFDSAGMIHIDFSQQDVDELASYPAPVYQVMCTFSCEAPASVSKTVALTNEVANPDIHPTF
ncbi:MAG TPA: hypothetical protein VF450_19540 [Noviherbaspirillum sp.]